MGFLIGSQPQAAQTPAITGLNIQTSAYGLCRTLAFGRCRVAGNLLWYGDFQSQAHTQNAGGGKGGGGGGGKGGGATTYTYSASFSLGLCEGPISAVITVYNNKVVQAFSASGLTLFAGALGQASWGYLTTNYPHEAIGYSGLAYVAVSHYNLDTSAQLPNFGFEIDGLLQNVPSQMDCDPADVIRFLLTDLRDGCGFPSAQLSDLTGYSNYCRAADFLISPAYTNQQTAADMIKNIAAITNSEIVYSPGKLDLIPYGDEALSGNGATWSPISAPLYDLTDDDFLNKAEPIKLTRTRPADAYNSVTLEFLDRANQYATETFTARDMNRIDLYGDLPASVKQAHEFCDGGRALHSAHLMLQRQYVQNIYEFTIGWRYIVLDQMDIVTVTDPALGLNRQWVRIKDIEEDDKGQLKITAEEVMDGTGAAALYAWQNPNGYYANYGSDSGPANIPYIFEPPAIIAANELWIAVSGGSNWGGCDVYASTDNQSYIPVGQIRGSARHGTLISALPASPASWDVLDTLSVDLTPSRSQLFSGSVDDAKKLNTLCVADGEWLAYATATLKSQYKYDLTTLNRGAYATALGPHSAGSKFARIDSNIFKLSLDPGRRGQTLYFKFAGRNVYFQNPQDLSTLSAYSYLVSGCPPPFPASVTSYNYNGKTFIKWNDVSDSRGAVRYKIEIQNGSLRPDNGLPFVWGPYFSDDNPDFYYSPSPVPNFQCFMAGTYFVTVIAADGSESAPVSITITLATVFAAGYQIVSNQLTIGWTPISDPAITGYNIYGMSVPMPFHGSSSTLLASVPASASNWSAGYTMAWVRYWVVPVTASGELYNAACVDVLAPTPPDSISVQVSDPNLVISWPPVLGASDYTIFLDGGITQIFAHYAGTSITWPIPAYNTMVYVWANFPDGRRSMHTDRYIIVAGIYQQNSVASISLDFSLGSFLNMTQANSNQLERPSILGAPVVSPYITNADSADCWTLPDEWDCIAAGDLDSTPAGWMRDNWWQPENASYESQVYDFGEVLTGRLQGTLTKSIIDYTTRAGYSDNLGASQFDYLQNAAAVEDVNAHIVASFWISTDNINWTPANINDWVTCRYIKFRVGMVVASPLLDVAITEGAILLDTPDVIAGGQVSITGGSLTQVVTLSKTFNKIQSVILTCPVNAYADWGTSKTQFTITLASNPGTTVVNWQAKGY